MLKKLLKYDFKWINKVMCIYFIILFIVSIAVRIIETIHNMGPTLLTTILDKIMSGAFISLSISVIITCLIRIWVRFIQNGYKDESYLTHTLPVTKNEIFNSKILASILSIVLSVLVILVCFSITYLNNTTIDTIKVMYESLVNAYGGIYAICYIAGLVILVLLEIIYLMMSGIFGIVVGYRSNNYKTIKSIIVGIVSYGVLSVVSLLILILTSNLADFEIISNGFPSLNSIKILGLTSISMYLIYNLIYYFVSKKLLNKGVNVN